LWQLIAQLDVRYKESALTSQESGLSRFGQDIPILAIFSKAINDNLTIHETELSVRQNNSADS